VVISCRQEHRGPSFYRANEQFRSILRYNNSTSYAWRSPDVARLHGGRVQIILPVGQRGRPNPCHALKRVELQERLEAGGFDPAVLTHYRRQDPQGHGNTAVAISLGTPQMGTRPIDLLEALRPMAD